MTKKSNSRIRKDNGGVLPGQMFAINTRPTGILGKMVDSVKVPEAPSKKISENNCWDELNAMYAKCAMVFTTYSQLGLWLKNAGLQAYMSVDERQGFKERIEILVADLNVLKNELIEMYSKHKDKHGGLSGNAEQQSADQLLSIEIFQHYAMWVERHDGVCQPTYQEISAMAMLAETRMKAASEQDLLDKNVVSDVVVNETAHAE